MKNKRLLWIFVIVLVAFGVTMYFRYMTEPEFSYGSELAALQGEIFANVDRSTPKITSRLSDLMARAREDQESEKGDEQVLQLVVRLYHVLREAADKREEYKGQLENVKNADLSSFAEGGRGQKREFYVSRIHRAWEAYVRQARPVSEGLLRQIQRLEGRP